MSRNWVFRSRVRDTVSALAKSIVRHILEPDITLRLTLDRVLAHEWVRTRKDKTGSLAGRLVHSAPPIHPGHHVSSPTAAGRITGITGTTDNTSSIGSPSPGNFSESPNAMRHIDHKLIQHNIQ
ncbi:Uncharacterized protein GBIM_04026 [Gryllus bimaculatus]|nr:Uncharacterized protein GBIM_04026 [Gryllus bimaculatus]